MVPGNVLCREIVLPRRFHGGYRSSVLGTTPIEEIASMRRIPK